MAGSSRIAKPSLWQRVTARIAPRWSAERAIAASARGRAMREAQAHYDAAKKSRRNQQWRVSGEDANAAARGTLAPLRSIARDMVRNNPHAARAVHAIAANVVGSGILPQVKGVTKTRAKAIEKLLRRHLMTPSIDADGMHNLPGLQALAMRTIVTSGEVLVRRRWRRASDGLPLPFQLQVLEPDFLDHRVEGPQRNGNIAIGGIEFDKLGRRVAYWLFSEHPGATSLYSFPTSKPVPASEIAHVYLAERPGQVRGVTWFAPVITKMRDFADFTDAQLVRQKIAACFAAFVTGDPEAETEVTDAAATSEAQRYPVEAFEPGMIQYLNPGDEVTFASPPQVGDFETYSYATLHEIAAGLNIPYTVLTGNLRGVNFSSGRMGWLEFQRAIEQWQTLMIDPMLLYRVAQWTIEALALSKGGVSPDMSIDWIAPAREMIDPESEINAAILSVRAGFSSRAYQQRRMGFDPDDLEDEIAADNDRADAAGFIFDTDPRKTASKGTLQKSASKSSEAPAPAAAWNLRMRPIDERPTHVQ